MTDIPDGRYAAPSGEDEQKRAASAEVDERVQHGAGEAQSAVGESARGTDDSDDKGSDNEKGQRPDDEERSGSADR